MTEVQRATPDVNGTSTAVEADSVDDSVDLDTAEPVLDDEREPRRRQRRQWRQWRRTSDPTRLRRQRRLAVIGLAVLPLVGASLIAVGLNRVWTGTLGSPVAAGLEPHQPNYAALVTPTPTFLVMHADEAGELASVTLLSLRSNDQGGSVLVIPVGTKVPGGETGDTDATEGSDVTEGSGANPATLGEAYAEGGARRVKLAVEDMLNVAVAETEVRDDAGWGRMVGPVAPLSLTLPEAVGDRWPAGPVQLAASDVGEFLRTDRDGESELNRVSRVELFWEAWIGAVSEGDDDAVPGDVEMGISRFVQGLGAGASTVHSLPVAPLVGPDGFPPSGETEVFVPDDDLVPDLVADVVRYPEEPTTGSRIRVRLLNGTQDQDLALRSVEPLVRAGAQIAISGNASSFSESTTRFVYTEDDNEARARRLRDALGAGTVEFESPEQDTEHIDEDKRIDVTVILGEDAPRAIGRLETAG